ncbi:DUF805 domain-containing protein [Lacinutrix sp. Bg11-31]|uniref:DUF805 domain-containing protein n=1 Tax=Lacinutrix sp. Bg11-31 TaxID=2057808 RepID=UPI000C308B2B|nr:DUF805 domain-containing protein [Lacinutrix sp. Bg11-31]AUC81392.1 DUF805 domain-containing protein [Lacinutrix sp. Bg11-31]
MKWYLHCIKNYTNFSGRARRSEYWMFLLFNILIVIALSYLSSIINEVLDSDNFIFIPFVYILLIIVPHFAVVVRRLHDINKSGTYWFVRFIPLVGPIWLLVLLVEDSSIGVNKYGRNPKKEIDENSIDLIGKE